MWPWLHLLLVLFYLSPFWSHFFLFCGSYEGVCVVRVQCTNQRMHHMHHTQCTHGTPAQVMIRHEADESVRFFFQCDCCNRDNRASWRLHSSSLASRAASILDPARSALASKEPRAHGPSAPDRSGTTAERIRLSDTGTLASMSRQRWFMMRWTRWMSWSCISRDICGARGLILPLMT